MQMTRNVLRDICMQNKLYRTPHLNDKLYLNFKGFTHIAGLEEYTGLKALFLEGNALQSLAGLPRLEELKCLYVQQNCLRSLEALSQVPNLNTLNVSSNGLASLQGLEYCSELSTLAAERNHLSTVEALQPILQCSSLHTLDLKDNNIEDIAVVDLVAELTQLRCLYLAGNPAVSKISQYRKVMISRCSQLTYLDDRPVTDEERLLAQAWAQGGVEAERIERVRQKEEHAAKERRNFEWLQQLRREGFRKRRAMLGLPDGDTDPYFDTLPDQKTKVTEGRTSADESSSMSGDDPDGLIQEPPELLAARKRLAEYHMREEAGATRSNESCGKPTMADAEDPSEDGAVYLASVKAAQHELNCPADVEPVQSSACDTALDWPGSSIDHLHGKLASLRAVTQAALAAVGLDSTAHDRQQQDMPSTAAAESETSDADSKAQCSRQTTRQDQDPAAGTHHSAGIGASATVLDSFDLDLADSWVSATADTLSDGDGQDSSVEGASAALALQGTAVTHSEAPDAGIDTAAGSGPTAHPEDVVIEVIGAKPGITTAAPRLYDLD